jgi:phosphotransferase system enzyme I (PtsI)
MPTKNPTIQSERRYQGIAVAPGIAEGRLFLHLPHPQEIPFRNIEKEEIALEIKRFKAALLATQRELQEIQRRITDSVGAANATVFDAHLLLLEDPELIKETLQSLHQERYNIEHIFNDVIQRTCEALQKTKNSYLRERTVDIQDVSRRILRHLLGRKMYSSHQCYDHPIIVAHSLTPSDAAILHHENVAAFATEVGSKTSHTAIIARALGIPAIVGLHAIVSELKHGDLALLDGYDGLLIVHPTQETLHYYHNIKLQQQHLEKDLTKIRKKLPITQDGCRIILSANIELPQEIDEVLSSGAEGIGLYRTEFLYLNRMHPPEEDEQYAIFRKIAERSQPHSVIIRTFDVGADKPVKCLEFSKESNPFLGCRGIRFCLQNRELFKIQLRAILRAAVTGNLRMMYPMISCYEELREANAVLEEAKQDLRDRNAPFCEHLEVGIMIEVPSAAIIADLLAKEVKFFSIGTNDLIQYLTSVDRGNESIAYLYNPAHTGVVRTLKMIIDAGHAAGIWVGVCGELAGDLLFTPLLVGLGIDELSASPILVPRIKKAIQSLELSKCQHVVEQMLNGHNTAENYAHTVALAQRCYGALLSASQQEATRVKIELHKESKLHHPHETSFKNH